MDPKEQNTQKEVGDSGEERPLYKRQSESSVRPLRTYKDDVAQALGKNRGSVLDITAAEEKRRATDRKLSERVRKLQEEIEQEGGKIRETQAQLDSEQTKPTLQKKPDTFSEIKHELVQETPAPKPSPERIEQARKELEQVQQEQEKRRPVRIETQSKSTKSTIKLLFIAFLFIGTGAALWFAYFEYQNFGTVAPRQETPSLIITNIQKKIELENSTRTHLIERVETARNTLELSAGSAALLQIVRGESTLSAEDFLATLAPSVPQRLSRSVEPVYTFGFYQTASAQEPFLVLSTTFFENAFAGMLAWESSMQTDLSPLFGTNPTTPDTLHPFTDIIIQNKDARVLYDINNNIALLYSFIDRETIVITTSIETFLEIFGRITSQQVVR
jgi:hypothetical protein